MTAIPHDRSFSAHLARRGLSGLRRAATTTLQVNLGKRCNQACRHCHVDAGPARTEAMAGDTMTRLLEVLARSPGVATVDVTGGAPELHPDFRHLVGAARRLGRHVMDRCNLTVLLERGQEDLLGFLADERVEVVASLPCYGPENVDTQRGGGVFERSIAALRALNAAGYGRTGSGLVLNLVYNPIGPTLPPDQSALETAYRRALGERFGITFDRLFTITNMPISRFRADLERDGRLEPYLELLADRLNPATVDGLMCRGLVSVGWDGRLFDCDFNQMTELALGAGSRTIWDVDRLDALDGAPIATAEHCLGCTAGSGSSCGGAVT